MSLTLDIRYCRGGKEYLEQIQGGLVHAKYFGNHVLQGMELGGWMINR